MKGERKNYRLSHSWLALQREFIESIDIYKDNASSAVLLTLKIFFKNIFAFYPTSIGAEPKKNRTVKVSER